MTRPTPVPRSEAQLVTKLIDRICDMQRGHARKVHGSRFQAAGEPDVDACVSGRAVKVEAKMPGEVPTPVQYASMRRWERAGALVGWVTSVSELDRLLAHVSDLTWRNPQVCKHRHVTGDGYVCDDCGARVDPPPTRDGL